MRITDVTAAITRTGALGLRQREFTWRNGITAALRIGHLARAAGIPVSPHRGGEDWGPHLMAASGWADRAEYHSDHISSARDVLCLHKPAPVDGYIMPSDRPGLGVTVNESML